MKKILFSKWFALAAFLALYLGLRVFWLDGDSGIPSYWEYGYHVTDEGYYLSGGKEMYLWHSVIDLARGESLTYGYAAGMHWLSYLAHLLFGLSTWAWRLPFFALYLLAGVLSFLHVARRAGTPFALATSLALATTPLLVVYERTASNDTLMAALLVISYVIAYGRGVWRIPAAALTVSFLILVKPAVWALLPVTLAGVLATPKTRSKRLDAALFIALAVALAWGWKALAAASVAGEASALGLGAWEALGRLVANYGLPNFFDFANDFKAFAAFPRDPSFALLGPLAVLLTALPLMMLMRQATRRAWNAHTLIYLAMPAYVAAVSVMNTLYTHYYLPMIALLPILFASIREDLSAAEPQTATREPRALIIDAILLAAFIGFGFHLLSTPTLTPQVAQTAYSRIYNLPAVNPWSLTGGFLAVGLLVCLALFAFRRGPKALLTDGPAAALFLFAVLSVSLAVLPAVVLAPHLHASAARYLAPMLLNLLVGGAIFHLFLLHPDLARRRGVLAAILPAVILLTYVATPTGRAAAAEILKPATHHHAEVAAELKKLVPEDAVVIGERTDQAFLSLPIRTAATFISNSDPTPVIEALWKRNPKTKLYAFADSQHAYNLQHYKEHQKDFALQLVKTFKLPSFATGKPADVHLCRIIDKRGGAK